MSSEIQTRLDLFTSFITGQRQKDDICITVTHNNTKEIIRELGKHTERMKNEKDSACTVIQMEEKRNFNFNFGQETLTLLRRYYDVENETLLIRKLITENLRTQIQNAFKEHLDSHKKKLPSRHKIQTNQNVAKTNQCKNTLNILTNQGNLAKIKTKEILTDKFLKEKTEELKIDGTLYNKPSMREIMKVYKIKTKGQLNHLNPQENAKITNELLENYNKMRIKYRAIKPIQTKNPVEDIFTQTNSKIYFKVNRDKFLFHNQTKNKFLTNVKANSSPGRILSSKLKIKINK